MSKLRVGGNQHPGMPEILKAREALKNTLDVQSDTINAVDKGLEPPPVSSNVAQKQDGAAIIQDAMKDPQSRIDWTMLAALKEGGPAAVQAAIESFRASEKFEHAVVELNWLVLSFKALPEWPTEQLYIYEAQAEYKQRFQLVEQITRVEAMIEAAGESPAVANFPKAQIAALKKDLMADLADLVAVKGPDVKKAPPLDPRQGSVSLSSWKQPPPKPPFPDPTPEKQLPVRVSLTAAQVCDLDCSIQSIVKSLVKPDLKAELEALVEKTTPKKRDALVKVLGAFAILADEATTAPDYKAKKEWGHGLGFGADRAHYRARNHAKPSPRNEASRKELRESLLEALDKKNVISALEKMLVEGFLTEIGVPKAVRADWKPDTKAVMEALENEAFLPLRFVNDYQVKDAKYWGVKDAIKELYTRVTQAFVEGNYEAWLAELPTSKTQLRSLTEEGRLAWNTPLETKAEIKDSKGQPVTLTTHEARGVERLWVTKGHTGSHGFDHEIGTPCLLAFLTNARTEAIVIDDPRWPQHAGRMYMRLIETPDQKPIMFVESMAKDFQYPCQDEAEEALLRHAMQKAKACGAQLVISGYAQESVDRMKLKGAWTPADKLQFVFTPTPLIEATVAFGKHDWVHQHTDARTPNKDAFVFAGE